MADHPAIDELAHLLVPEARKPAERHPGASSRRWGVVTFVNAGPPPTLAVDFAGNEVSGLRYKRSYAAPAVGDTVIVEIVGTDWVVDGPLAS